VKAAFFFLNTLLLVSHVFGQTHEIGLTLGSIARTGRIGQFGSLDSSSGTALQANYGHPLWKVMARR
jgi:hypothetical protein